MTNDSSNYIYLKGGLGNQLFQYGFAMYLKKRGLKLNGFLENFEGDAFGRRVVIDKVIKGAISVKKLSDVSGVMISSEDYLQIAGYLESDKNLAANVLNGYWQQLA
jgi:hypothetical protein